MRWELISSTDQHEIYHLINEEKKLLTLELNSFSQTARIECNEQRRVFIIRREGFLRNRTVIRNEYGMKIGELGSENREKFIAVDNEKFYYSYRNNPLAELVIKNAGMNQIASCSLITRSGKTGVEIEKHEDISNAALLMGICWYLFLPIAKENVAAFA